MPPCAQHEAVRKGAEVACRAEAAVVARQLAEAKAVGPPDSEHRFCDLRDLVVARVAHDQLVAPDDCRVRRPGRTEHRDDARVEDVQDSARVRQRIRQREVEPSADERSERSC